MKEREKVEKRKEKGNCHVVKKRFYDQLKKYPLVRIILKHFIQIVTTLSWMNHNIQIHRCT